MELFVITNLFKGINCSPGPIYNPDLCIVSRMKRSPSYTIKGRNIIKKTDVDIGPGPGAYNPSIEPLKPNAPSISITSKNREPTTTDHQVGPNQYNLPNSIGNKKNLYSKTAPAYSIACKSF
jgi:hypothetical protein